MSSCIKRWYRHTWWFTLQLNHGSSYLPFYLTVYCPSLIPWDRTHITDRCLISLHSCVVRLESLALADAKLSISITCYSEHIEILYLSQPSLVRDKMIYQHLDL